MSAPVPPGWPPEVWPPQEASWEDAAVTSFSAASRRINLRASAAVEGRPGCLHG
jgi:hypothetical protein